MERPEQVTYPLEATIEAWKNGEVTQLEIAERTGISTAAVHRLLRGGAGYSYRRAVKCYEALQAIRAERAASSEKEGI